MSHHFANLLNIAGLISLATVLMVILRKLARGVFNRRLVKRNQEMMRHVHKGENE
jgi:hypothetical protein